MRPAATRILVVALCGVLSSALLSACATGSGARQGGFDPGEPRSVADYLSEGDREYRAGDRDAALVQYVLALENGDESADTYYKVGTIHRSKGNLDLAQSSFKRALAADPDLLPAVEALGLTYLQRENYALAEVSLLDAVRRDARRPDAQNALGILYDLQERYSDARPRYLAAIEAQPRQPKYANNLGYSYYLEGQFEEAAGQFRRAIDLDGDFDLAWANLALVYAQLGDRSRARDAFARINDEHVALNNLGYLHLLLDQQSEAKRNLRAAVSAAPTYYPVARRNLDALDDPSFRNDIDEDREQLAARRAEVSRSVEADRPRDAASPSDTASKPAMTSLLLDAPASAFRQDQGTRRGDASSAAAVLAPDDPDALEPIDDPSVSLIRSVQQALLDAGFKPGTADGQLGSRTRAAIRLFEVARRMPVSGAITPKLLEQMGIEPA